MCTVASVLGLASDAAWVVNGQDGGSPGDEVFIVGKDLLHLLENDPDAVILVGDSARKYLDSAKARGLERPIIFQQCEMRGEIVDRFARLHIEITARSEAQGRIAMPLGLAEATLLAVSVDGNSPFLTRDAQGWIAWVDGAGKHTVVVDVQLPVTGTNTQGSIACAIPEAPITSLRLTTERGVSEVRVVPAGPVTVRAPAGGPMELEVALGPRNKLDLRWRWQTGPATDLAPLLRAKSQVTAAIEPEGIQIRTELRIQALRGGPQTIELRNTPDERVLDLQTNDGKVVGWQSTVEQGVQRILVHYPEPLVGTSELVITSERPWSGGMGVVRGWVVDGAYSHLSLVALRSVPDLDVAVTGLENAQPAETLPATLRSPRNEAAFASYSQPYQLSLSIVPRRAHTTVRTTVLVSYDDDLSEISARWRFTVHGGKVSQVDFKMPGPFRAENFLFSESVHAIREEETPSGRVAHLFIKGAADEFDVRLRAAVALPAAGNLVKLELPRPQDAESESSRLYLAESPDIDLEPTPNLLPDEDPADEANIKELNGTGVPFRAFECRALIDQLAFRLSKSTAAILFQMHGQVRVSDESIQIRQAFDFATAGVAPRQIRFAIPPAIRNLVRVESVPAGSIADIVADDLLIRLPPQPAEPLRVELSYQWPSSMKSEPELAVTIPLVQAVNAQCEMTEVTVHAPRHLHLSVEPERWRTISAAGDSSKAETRWVLRRVGAAEHLAFHHAEVSWLSQAAIVVDRTLHSTIVDAKGRWRTRSRFAVTESGGSPIRVRIRAGRLVNARWNERDMPVRPGAEPGTVELLDLAPNQSAGLLEIETDGNIALSGAAAHTMLWDNPELLGHVVRSRVYWQIELPDALAMVRGPIGYTDENAIHWRDLLQPKPRQDQLSLERWITGSDAVVPISSGQRLLFSRMLTDGPLVLVVASRWVLVLICSGLALAAGLVLVALPPRIKLPIVVLLLSLLVVLSAASPHTAAECLRSAGWGLSLALFAGVSHLLLIRRRPFRRSVFPEPSQLVQLPKSAPSSRGPLPVPATPDSNPDLPQLVSPSSIRN